MLKDYLGLYDVDENGVVTNLRTGKILKPQLNGAGYYQVLLCKNGKPKAHAIHRLIAEKYLANFSNNLDVDHIDRCKTNNALSNLRMITHQQNLFNTSAKGYSYNKQSGKWMACIKGYGKQIYLGLYSTEAEAAAAYAAAKEKYQII